MRYLTRSGINLHGRFACSARPLDGLGNVGKNARGADRENQIEASVELLVEPLYFVRRQGLAEKDNRGPKVGAALVTAGRIGHVRIIVDSLPEIAMRATQIVQIAVNIDHVPRPRLAMEAVDILCE